MTTWTKIDSDGFVSHASMSDNAPDSTWVQNDEYPIFGKAGFKYQPSTGQWVAIQQAELQNVEAANVRTQRNQLLAQSDWTDTVSAQTRLGALFAAWQTYRQTLRDIPAQSGFPFNITWPNPPASS
jgi:hypothetical protein